MFESAIDAVIDPIVDAIEEQPLSALWVFPAAILIGQITSFLCYQADKASDAGKVREMNKRALR